MIDARGGEHAFATDPNDIYRALAGDEIDWSRIYHLKFTGAPVVDDTELRRLARQHSSSPGKNGTRNLVCCAWEHHWTVRYDLHHFAERDYDDRTIRLCRTCHEKGHRHAEGLSASTKRYRPAIGEDDCHDAWSHHHDQASLAVDEEAARLG